MATLDAHPVPDYLARLSLEGRGFIVLGAGFGMGRQVAHALAQAGAQLVCVDVEKDRAVHVAGEVGGIAHVADATDPDQARALVDSARTRLDRFYGVVDVIGMARWQSIIDTTDEDWDWSQSIVLRHAFNMVRFAGRALAESGEGCLTFVASISGVSSSPAHGAYGVAKAGLLSLVRTAAVELRPKGVRVNAVSPGAVATERIAKRHDSTPAELAAPSLGAFADMSDIAAALLFLSSDLARYVSGVNLSVDAGDAVTYPYDMTNALDRG